MKNKIIITLSIIIVALFAFFQTYRLSVSKSQIDDLKSTVEEMQRQHKKNIYDLLLRNEELKNAYILQKKANKIKGDKCLDSTVNSDFSRLLRENHRM